MTHRVIRTTVDQAVRVRRGDLRITKSGGVAPVAYGASGILVPFGTNGVVITNEGRVEGATGIDTMTAGSGGVGVELKSAATLNNLGSISGGPGGGSYIIFDTAEGGTGGVGVELRAGATAANGGNITGGKGGDAAYGGTGGIGAELVQGATLTSTGTIRGGNGGRGYFADGGVGVSLASGAVMTNTGTIVGGNGNGWGFGPGGEGSGAAGVQIGSAGTLTNFGLIEGGSSAGGFSGAGVGVALQAGGVVTNHGIIRGGSYAGGLYGGYAGNGVTLLDGTLTNSGLIAGGDVAVDGRTRSLNSVGVDQTGGLLTNSGIIVGGRSGEAIFDPKIGGTGVMLGGAGVAINTGRIFGGAGTVYGYAQGGSAGGIGIQVSAGSVLTNAGSITGGVGGDGNQSTGGAGGDGVYLNGGTLIDSGLITGGAGGTGLLGNGAQGQSVAFGTEDSTLALDPGARFHGQVAADPAANDTLALVGNGRGVLAGLGTAFTGFTTVMIASGADWRLAGPNAIGAATGLLVDGALHVSGVLNDQGPAAIGGLLRVGEAGTVQLAEATLNGGTLACAQGGLFAIGTSVTGAVAGDITVQGNAALTGFGALAAPVLDDGTITATGGTLNFSRAVGGSGTLALSSGSELRAHGAVSAAILFEAGGNETLRLDAPASVAGTISGFGTGDTIDLDKLRINGLQFQGGTLSLESQGMVVGELCFSGPYSLANFQLASDDHGGTDISFGAALPGPAQDHGFPREAIAHLDMAWTFGVQPHAMGEPVIALAHPPIGL